MKTNQYLVIEDRVYGGSIALNYGNDMITALRDYEFFESLEVDCVLLGADSLETLKTTHSNWVNIGTEERKVKK